MSKDKAPLAIDFSKFTDEDLEAYERGETSTLSDNALEALADYEDKFNETASKVGQYREPEATPYGLTTAAAGTVGALATGIAPRSSQQLVDKMLPEDLRGGYKAPAAAAPTVARPTVAPAPGSDYFSPFGAGEGAVKNATHNVDEVLKNKVAQAAIQTPGYVAPGNSLILQPSSGLPTPKAPVATPGSPVLPTAKPKMGMPQMRAALQSPEIMPANRLPSSIKGGAAAGFGANAIEEARRGNYGDAATSAIGSGSSIAAMASNPKLARAGKLGMAATILGKGYQALQNRGEPEQRAMGGLVGYAGGKAVKGGLEAAKKLFDPRFDKRVLEQEKLANQVLKTEKTGTQNIPKIYLPDYEGYGMVTSMSDRTAGGSRLLGVNDVNFNRPVELTGGQEYMYNNPGQVWASGKNPVNQIMREAVEVKKATGKDPLYMPWRMAPTASDFAHMTGETMLTHAQSAMGKSQKKDLDNTIKKFIPNWSGIDDPESMQQFMVAPAKARKSIQNAIDRDLRGSGAMSIGETRLAIADPNQLTAPEGGLMHVGRISADKPVIEASGNVTYPKGVPGEGVGQLEREHFVTEFLPDFVKERGIIDPRAPGQTDIRALQMKPYSGIIDDKLLKSLGYAEGGEVQGYSKGKKVIDAGLGFLKPSAKSHSQDPNVARALEEYLKGNITQEERIAAVNKYLPLRPWNEMPPAYSDEQIKMALMENKRPKALADVPVGARVGNRLDIPAYTQHGVYVDTTHDLAQGNSPISYNRTGHLKDVEFSSKPNQAVRVGLGTKEQALTPMGAEMGSAKSPFALIKGTNVGTSDEEVRRMMAEMMRDPSYAQIGMDPRRHSQFYDKSTGMPVWAAEEKLQSGPLILAPRRGLETTSWDDPRLNLSDFEGKKYAKGGSTSPAWQRKEGKNPEGGLNAAGRASYNRETGGNLKAPQPEGGPRKKSFCARMEGMKKKNTSSATANDPDSRINKSLRKWKC